MYPLGSAWLCRCGCHQRCDVLNVPVKVCCLRCAVFWLCFCLWASAPREALQRLQMTRRLSSVSVPPKMCGMMWSTSGLAGVWLRVQSRCCRQREQWVRCRSRCSTRSLVCFHFAVPVLLVVTRITPACVAPGCPPRLSAPVLRGSSNAPSYRGRGVVVITGGVSWRSEP